MVVVNHSFRFGHIWGLVDQPWAFFQRQDDAEKWNAAIAPKEQQLAPWQNTDIARYHSMS